MRKQFFKNAKRIVIKIGSSILTSGKGNEVSFINHLVDDLSQVLKIHKQLQVSIVSSGAIAVGMKHLNIKKRPRTMPQLQAIAALGQPLLMHQYASSLKKHKLNPAQVLLTREDLANRTRYQSTQKTLEALLHYGAIPIINENDTISTKEIEFGDNDQLSSMVASLFNADLLIFLSDSDGFYADFEQGSKTRISMVDDLRASLFESIRDVMKSHNRGGMTSKLIAIQKALRAGVPCLLANGQSDNILSRLFSGEDRGTIFLPKVKRLTSKKHWIAYMSKTEGSLVLDEGAELALTKKGKSLLSKGILKSQGHFEAGSSLILKNNKGKELGRGIINFSSEELSKIIGFRTDEWSERLGRPCLDEVIHRDNFVTR